MHVSIFEIYSKFQQSTRDAFVGINGAENELTGEIPKKLVTISRIRDCARVAVTREVVFQELELIRRLTGLRFQITAAHFPSNFRGEFVS